MKVEKEEQQVVVIQGEENREKGEENREEGGGQEQQDDSQEGREGRHWREVPHRGQEGPGRQEGLHCGAAARVPAELQQQPRTEVPGEGLHCGLCLHGPADDRQEADFGREEGGGLEGRGREEGEEGPQEQDHLPLRDAHQGRVGREVRQLPRRLRPHWRVREPLVQQLGSFAEQRRHH